MHFLSPHSQWQPQDTTPAQHIARIGRICYKSEGKQPDPNLSDEEKEAFLEQRDTERCQAFWQSGHRSMYRHGSMYFFIKDFKSFPQWFWHRLTATDYVQCFHPKKCQQAWLSTNCQFMTEHPDYLHQLQKHQVSEESFIASIIEHQRPNAFNLLRMTFVVTTQISTTRELNRTSPNCIAEQSTRYVNLRKKGGVQICTPHWFAKGGVTTLSPLKHSLSRLVFRTSCKLSEWAYLLLLKLGLKPQDARGILPLDTYSVVAYTYSLNEWRHILDLRYHGTTGTPHPNAKLVASQIRDQINQRLSHYNLHFSL